MKSDREITTSLWMLEQESKNRPSLEEKTEADVCVIGAGITGLTTAYLLARAGKSVVVIDDGRIACGQSARTSAHLSCVIDDRFMTIEKNFGVEGSHLAAASHAEAINTIERISREEGIHCQFKRVDAYLFADKVDEAHLDFLRHELSAAHRAGLADAELFTASSPTHLSLAPFIRFPRQAQFHPLRYLTGLAHAFERAGGRIFEMTHAKSMRGGPQAMVRTVSLLSGRGAAVQAQSLVVATNSPVNDRLVIHTKQAAYRTYVVALKIPSGSVAPALFWDTAEPYHYVRVEEDTAELARGFDLLIVGGEDHRTGQENNAEQRYGRLKAWARQHFPMVGEAFAQWSGQVMETMDGLAYIGHNPLDADNVYVATGDSGMGLTHGTIAGILLSDLICQRPNAWQHLYDPARVSRQSLGEFARENLVTLAWYGKWLDLSLRDRRSPHPRHSGWIERRGISQVAMYKDDAGQVHEMSAVCPHLGGIVSWNAGEGTWDCPCHGSRFDAYGRVINGPANEDLRPLKEELPAMPLRQPPPSPGVESARL